MARGNRSQWQRMSDDADNIFNSFSPAVHFILILLFRLHESCSIYIFFFYHIPISCSHDSCSFYLSVLHIFHVTKKASSIFPSNQNAIAQAVCLPASG